jgi:serine/threonine protein kinase
VLLDRGCIGRIGDFGIAKSLISNTGGVTARHMHTNQVMGTQVYMSPEYKNGTISTKIDSFAFGIVVLEALTGYHVMAPAPGHKELLSMFEDALDTPDKLLLHLDKRTCWDQQTTESINTLHSITERCSELRRNRRPEMVDLIPELEELRRNTESQLPPATELSSDGKECVVCLAGGDSVEGWMMMRPCGHVCVCLGCGQGLRECPMCRKEVVDSFPAFL